MSRLRSIFSASEQTLAQPDHGNITPSRNYESEKVGSGKECLFSELEKLYWLGAKAELDNIVTTLRIWRQSDSVQEARRNGAPTVPGASEGFEFFLDSVSQRTREYASRYDNMVKEAREFEKEWEHMLDWDGYQETTANLLLHRKMRNASSKIRKDVKSRVTAVDADDDEQLAWLLLQASGFLDIDKAIEYRKQPDEKASRQTAIPQLAVESTNNPDNPAFTAQRCQQAGCTAFITSSMYAGHVSEAICETCYRRNYYREPGYDKVHKHCAINDAITPMAAERMCLCPDDAGKVSRDASGYGSDDEKTLAPDSNDPEKNHLNGDGKAEKGVHIDVRDADGDETTLASSSNGASKDLNGMDGRKHNCGLLKLGPIEASAKYEGLKVVAGEEVKSGGRLSTAMARLTTRDDKAVKKSSSSKKRASAIFSSKGGRDGSPSARGVFEDPAEDTNVPQFFRKFADDDAFSHVHMSLRVGPLVIENGVGSTKHGALVTIRDMPYYTTDYKCPGESLVIDGEDKAAWKQNRSPRRAERKRYKAIMKQVVGLPFSTLPDSGEERDIVKEVVEASASPPLHDAGSQELQTYDAFLEGLLRKLRGVLSGRLETYLRSVVERLLDPDTSLTWDPIANNCQTFCNSVLDRSLFKPLFGGPAKSGNGSSPLYAMSFVCPDEGYHQRIVRTKHDVAPGFTEEYLGNLYFGRHEESDLLDNCQEYWYDWAGLDKPICKHGELFPFDCTRAMSGPKHDGFNDCGDCGLSRHLWAFPYDSWAMLSMHLARDPFAYYQRQPHDIDTPEQRASWFTSRLEVLHAQSILCRAASAMTNSPLVQSSTAWMHSSSSPLAKQPSLTRIRMGGIHRAQPMSHYYERGANNLYFLATWAPVRDREEQYLATRRKKAGRSDHRPEHAIDRFTKVAKPGSKELVVSKRAPKLYVGFAGLNVAETGASAPGNMFKTGKKQTLVAIGAVSPPLDPEGRDSEGLCGSSECGGPACGTAHGGAGGCWGVGTCGGGGCIGIGGGCGGGGGPIGSRYA